MTKQEIIGLIVMASLVLCSMIISGCTTTTSYQCNTSTEFTVKETFQAIKACGYGSSTEYCILTDTEEIFTIADTCDRDTSAVGMNQYYLWHDAKKGDTLIRDCNSKYSLRKTGDNR